MFTIEMQNVAVQKTKYGYLEKLSVNGDVQWIHVQGSNTGKPLILFLHGGPGFSQMAFAPILHHELAERFIVINWDQRATGKSFSRKMDYSSLSLSIYVQDTVALVKTLLKEYEQNKLYLVGHSWGSLLGMHVIKHEPRLFHAFVGTGFGVDFQDGEKQSSAYLLQKARQKKDMRAIEELSRVAFPITENTFDEYIKMKSKYMNRYGGYFYTRPTKVLRRIFSRLVFSGIYSLKDYRKMMAGLRIGREVGKRVLLSANLSEQVPQVDVPVHFFVGRHDQHTSFRKAQEYYEQLQAPKKTWIWFEASAHSPIFEESRFFCEQLITLV
jgi:pimeloyl-ACP methyl ester carboxylesterase